MDNYVAFFWLGVLVLSVIAEASTSALVAIWFMPSALCALILALFKVPIPIQFAVFLILSVLLLIFSRTILRKTRLVRRVPTNTDALIGKQAVVTEEIDNLSAKGQVRVEGQVWSARSEDASVKYGEGEVLVVVAIEGVKLICKNI